MQIITTSISKPPKICIYGAHGIGKSTFASETPDPIFIQTEDGLGALGVQAFPVAKSYGEVEAALRFLIKEKHSYRTVVIDSLDWLEKLMHEAICGKAGVSDLLAIPYGRGYTLAANMWHEFLDLLEELNNKGMLICLLAHAQITKFEDPERDNYDRYGLDLHKKAAPIIYEWVDVMGFVTYRTNTVSKDAGFGNTVVKAKGSGERVLCLEERPAYTAKNRYRMSDVIPFPEGESYKTFAAAYSAGIKKKGNLSAVKQEKENAKNGKP